MKERSPSDVGRPRFSRASAPSPSLAEGKLNPSDRHHTTQKSLLLVFLEPNCWTGSSTFTKSLRNLSDPTPLSPPAIMAGSSIGMMDSAYFVGRRAILEWLNTSFMTNSASSGGAARSAPSGACRRRPRRRGAPAPNALPPASPAAAAAAAAPPPRPPRSVEDRGDRERRRRVPAARRHLPGRGADEQGALGRAQPARVHRELQDRAGRAREEGRRQAHRGAKRAGHVAGRRRAPPGAAGSPLSPTAALPPRPSP